MEFRRAKLDNGLEIVAECNAEAHSAALGFFVNTGARDESPEVACVSHFLEHMAFKGTATRSADDVNREFDEMGSQYNAYTSSFRGPSVTTVKSDGGCSRKYALMLSRESPSTSRPISSSVRARPRW